MRARGLLARRFLCAAFVGAVLGLSCASADSGGQGSARAVVSRADSAGAPGVASPARYFVPESAWVERTEEGIDRVVANGCRMELRGAELVRAAPADPEVEGGAPVPPWAAGAGAGTGAGAGASGPASPFRYVFWKDKDLYGASTFLGELTRIATLPAAIRRAFDWLDGVGLLAEDGARRLRPGSGALDRLGPPGVVDAVAADARRGIALTVFGHALLTLDAGASFRDVTGDLDAAVRAEVRGESIAVIQAGGRRKFIDPAGAISDSGAALGLARAARPPDFEDPWPADVPAHPLELAAVSGVPLDDGGVAVAASGFIGRIDRATGRVTAVTALPAVKGTCMPIRVRDALLLACEEQDRAVVIDIRGAPRVERTFDLAGAADYDRFAGSDGEALGFIGPCDGSPPRPTDLDVVTAASPYSASTQRSPVFCVRASRDVWVEHRLDPADATDVLAWIPRPGGEAVALVARPSLFLDKEPRVSVRGSLRVIRLARGEPPLALPQYKVRSSITLARGLSAAADGAVRGWLPSTSYPSNVVGAVIDEAGLVQTYPAPSMVSALSTSGAFGMAQTEDGKLFETTSFGRRWTQVTPPPGSPTTGVSSCSPAGCRVGPLVRLGWTGEPPGSAGLQASAGELAAAALDEVEGPLRSIRQMRERQYRKPSSAAPVARLRCGFHGAAEGARLAESYAFGVTPRPVPRSPSGSSRITSMGTLVLPSNGSQLVPGGDAELAWVSPLDPAATVRRATRSLARASLDLRYRPYEVRVGYVIDAEGRVDPIAVGPKEACVASLLEGAGVTRPVGGCAADPSVGVDLGGRVLLVSARLGAITLTLVDAPPGRSVGVMGGMGAAGARLEGELASLGIVQREIGRITTPPGVDRYSFGAGSRDGAPVVVAVDGQGGAALAQVDLGRGTLGAEEPLAPLTDVALGGGAACAPRPGEARVVLPFDTEIGLDRATLPGVSATGLAGLAVLRWSPARVCLDAIELAVRDERHEPELGLYEPPGTLRKLVARFRDGGAASAPKGGGNGTIAVIMSGVELRQRVMCTGIGP